jgi:hypothetical protein
MFTDKTRGIFKGVYKHASLFKGFALPSNIIYVSFDVNKLACLKISDFSSKVLCVGFYSQLGMCPALSVKFRLVDKN